jgi:spore coat polysaccharide biosynthesis predicted glycosyltransferase SpsG
MRKFIIRCNQDRDSGFGHFSRCLNLARFIKANLGHDVVFYGNYDSFAVSLLKHYCLPFEIKSEKPRFSLPEPLTLNEFTDIITDSYLINQGYIDELVSHPIRTIFIDDTCELDFSGVELVINFRVSASSFHYGSNNIALGPKYFIHKPELLRVREKNEATKKEQRMVNILLFFGGGQNYLGVDKIIIDYLMSLNEYANITLIKNDFAEYNDSKYDKLVKQKPTFDIEYLYYHSDFVINGGGLTKYECCYCLIPSASLSTTDLQYKDSQILDKNNLLVNLGMVENLDVDELKEKLNDFLFNKAIKNRIIESSNVHFDENSMRNLALFLN